MKRITLPRILDSLSTMKDEVTVDPLVAGQGPPRRRAHGQPEELTFRRQPESESD